MDSGLLYGEGYVGYPRAGGMSSPWAWAWCLDGETVVDPAATRQGTAFFRSGTASGVPEPRARGSAWR
jgi:hypothetical protein